MKEKIKVYIVGRSRHYLRFIDNAELTENLQEADLVLFTGGEDVTPSIYGDTPHVTTYSSSSRDSFEMSMYSKAQKHKKKMLGICRGAQFLTAMAGGTLVQHVRNHQGKGRHGLLWDDGMETMITSIHHQMMNPYNLAKKDYKVLAISSKKLSPIYLCSREAKDIKMPEEPEIVYYTQTNALGVQGHPEMMDTDDPTVVKLNQLIKKWIKNDKIS
jgi:putative glutamine amidotransferase